MVLIDKIQYNIGHNGSKNIERKNIMLYSDMSSIFGANTDLLPIEIVVGRTLLRIFKDGVRVSYGIAGDADSQTYDFDSSWELMAAVKNNTDFASDLLRIFEGLRNRAADLDSTLDSPWYAEAAKQQKQSNTFAIFRSISDAYTALLEFIEKFDVVAQIEEAIQKAKLTENVPIPEE